MPQDWKRVSENPEFGKLVQERVRFVVPCLVFFISYSFSLPLLVGYAPELMSKPVLGPVNIAYLFALSQFFMAWIVAALYVRVAGRWDDMAHKIIAKLDELRRGN